MADINEHQIPQNHLETVEKTEEQNFNHIDGILNNLPTEEAAVSIDGGSLYLTVQTCDSGYDYTFFNGAFEELDGGQLENPTCQQYIPAGDSPGADQCECV